MGREHSEVMVSVCCITYNHKEYIRDTLEGILRQRVNFAYEILIHDDASQDGTAKVIEEYAARFPEKIFPILQTENQYSKGLTNISGTFNFPRARGKYIAMCEGDDYWTDLNKLQRQVDFMEAHPDCSICFHSARIEVLGRAVTERRMRPYRKSRRVSPEEMIDKQSGYPTASLLFPTDMVQALPDFYVNAPIADIPLQLLAAARGWGYYMDRAMCVYRLGGASSWTSWMKQGDYEEKQRRYRRAMCAMYREFDRETGGRFHVVAERAMRRLVFLTHVNTKNYQAVFQMKNREFYRELNLRTRMFIRIEVAAPALYRLLWRFFHRREK